ncbi:MAG: hypothetical protein QOG54_76 [Actinomycetota bacterium]|jgi:methyl-accepting chemotaxis protein|nr:hypothetical protein [Actinomycetota bacterium]
MRWLIAPLIAGFLFVTSGFLGSLESTTENSKELAAASEEAPGTTAEAANRVAPLPTLANLTTQQAAAFKELSDALDVSARRVFALNDALGRQATALDDLKGDLSALGDSVGCVSARLSDLNDTADRVAPAVNELTVILRSLVAAQDKAIRHLKSINRKLAALGAIATATDVEPPPPPPEPTFTPPDAGSPSKPC